MPVNRLQIRQGMLNENIMRGARYGTATAGQFGSLTDTTLLRVGGNPTSLYANRFLYRPAAATASDQLRRVNAAGYAPLTGVLVHQGPNWTIAPLGSGADSGYYELWPMDPLDLVNSAINRAMTKRCYRLMMDDIDLTAYDAQNEWVIGTAPWDIGIVDVWGDLLDILQIIGTPPTASFSPWMMPDPNGQGQRWEPFSDDIAEKVYFNTPPTGKLRIVWRQSYQALTTDQQDSDCDEELVVQASLYELFIAMEQRAQHAGEPVDTWTSLKESVYGSYWQRRTHLMGKYASDIIQRRTTGSMTRTAPPLARAGMRGGLGRVRGW